jgi:hypothetical protein
MGLINFFNIKNIWVMHIKKSITWIIDPIKSNKILLFN